MKLKLFLSINLLCFACSVNAQTQSIRSVLQPYIDSGELPGIVTIVAQPDKILSIESVGFTDIENNKKMTPDALFWIASQSKPITATAVMMLVDEGKVSLDEPVTTYLPELSQLYVSRVKRDNWKVEERLERPLTLRHLLSHTSGMQFTGGVQQQMLKIDVLPFNLSLYSTTMTPLIAEPGEQYNYANQGINIVATVIERVTGMSFDNYLQTKLFDPLGMKSATFWPTEKQLETLAKPYKKDENGKLEETTIDQLQYPLNDKEKRFAEAGGGLFCTPADLVKFYQMIANKGIYNGKRFLTEASVAEMGKKQTGKKIDAAYGLGWSISDTGMGHGGAYGTYSFVHMKKGMITMYFVQQENLPKADEALQSFHNIVNEIYGIKK